MSSIDKFLENLRGDEPELAKKWCDLIRPTTVNIILGRKGMGKSALGYFLLETIGGNYGLLPVVVNLPRGKQALLPSSFVIRGLDEVRDMEDSIVLIDEGTTMLPAGKAKMEEMVKGLQALSRQRNQIIILIFHSSSDVGSRILRGVDAILLKEPSQRQIQHGSKDNWWHDLLVKARDKFKTIANMGEDKHKYTFVDSEEPEVQGLLSNPLPSFWTKELSRAWAGVSITDTVVNQPPLCLTPTTGARLSDGEYVQILRAKSSIQKGENLACTVCRRATNVLISDTCEECFQAWALSTRKRD